MAAWRVDGATRGAGPPNPPAVLPRGAGPPNPPARRSSRQMVQVVAEPGHELGRDVLPLARELDLSAQVVELVAGVVTAAAGQHAVGAAAARSGPAVGDGQGPQRVGKLDLASAPRRGLTQYAGHRRVADGGPAADPDGLTLRRNPPLAH